MKKRLEDFIKTHLIQTVPSDSSYCAFDCRRLSCEGCPLKATFEASDRSN